jgi:O-antigen ligase
VERLTFNVSSGRNAAPVLVVGRRPMAADAKRPSRAARLKTRVAAMVRERYHWDYLWMLAFTALLFFRPQDDVPALRPLHLAELTAIAGLAAMAARRMASGQTITRVNPELVGVMALGAVIVLTIPFSFWPGGSLAMFSDVYVKIILIFALMMTTLTTPKRLAQLTWLIVIASGYIALRGLADYSRGVNLVEGDRLAGAVGGMFENPNDLALNLVTFMGPALFFALEDRRLARRGFALALAGIMFAAIVFTKSRSGFIGLAAMGTVVACYSLRRRPGLIFAIIFAGLVVLPMVPQSVWDRMSTITDAEAEQTGSRSQRIQLMSQGLQVFANNPLTGVGAGQFRNYDGPEMIERWRVTHNVWLQVAADLGIFGLVAFGFLVWRAFLSAIVTRRALAPPRRRARGEAGGEAAADEAWTTLTTADRRTLDTISKGLVAGLVGWFVCALFASVAFNWTFYLICALAVAGREIAWSRRVAPAAPVRRAGALRAAGATA